jgi:microcystin degradation protein MlrC
LSILATETVMVLQIFKEIDPERMLFGSDAPAAYPDLAAVRAAVGPNIPIVATLDLHANLTARMVRSADALIGYDRLPHTVYRSVGLEPAEARIVVVKTASGFRSGYADLAQAIYILDTPGYCPPNLRSLTYARAPRPLYPLDLDFVGWVLALI